MIVRKFVCRQPFLYDADLVSEETGLKCEDVSLAEQSEKDDADINVLLKRFGVTGQLPAANSIPIVTNGDFVAAMDCQGAMDMIRRATESFMDLPAEVRQEFNHDPARFVNFCSDEKNREHNLSKLREWGLAVDAAVAPVAAEPILVKVVPEVVLDKATGKA